MTWIYNSREFTSEDIQDNVGFVYLITNLTNSRMYIGQKKFFKTKTYQKNKKKKRKLIESDWKTYYGSSLSLQADVEKYGPDAFVRVIIHLCKAKGEMNYLELREQMMHHALLDERFYNDYCGTRIHRKHVEKARERILSAS